MGNAIISVDPVTHNIMVIADKQTSEQIRRVIASLDAPEPQVLIKVVFLEVQDNTRPRLVFKAPTPASARNIRKSSAI